MPKKIKKIRYQLCPTVPRLYPWMSDLNKFDFWKRRAHRFFHKRSHEKIQTLVKAMPGFWDHDIKMITFYLQSRGLSVVEVTPKQLDKIHKKEQAYLGELRAAGYELERKYW